MDFLKLESSQVKGLHCQDCDIASCTTSEMRTPVSKKDAGVKQADMSKLEWDKKLKMYFIKRNPDKSCTFFDHFTERCSLPAERRFNSCLVFPMRVYRFEGERTYDLIVSLKCPSALTLWECIKEQDRSAVNYAILSAKIFAGDKDYADHVAEKTKDFKEVITIGELDFWSNREVV